MAEIKLITGNEKRFAEFISKIDKKDKIALLSHIDLDGIVSAKIVNEVIKADVIKFVDYKELNSNLLCELKKRGINRIIMVDLYLSEFHKEFFDELKKFEVLMIDHHPLVNDWNSDKVIFINAQGYCAAYLCYVLFSKITNLENYDWLVVCASVSDWCYQNNKEWMKEVYKKYGSSFDEYNIQDKIFWEIFLKLGLAAIYFEDNLKIVFDSLGKEFGEIGSLGKYANYVQEEIDKCLNKFEREKEKINEGYLWEVPGTKYGIKSFLANKISAGYFDKTIILFKKEGNYCLISARRQDKKVDVGKLLQKLIVGFNDARAGGHVAASGGYFLSNDKEEFIRRVRKM